MKCKMLSISLLLCSLFSLSLYAGNGKANAPEKKGIAVSGAGIASGDESDLDEQPHKEEAEVSEKEKETSVDDKTGGSVWSLPFIKEKPQELWEDAKNMSTMRLAAFTGAVALIGYGVYKGYEALMAWRKDYAEGEQPMELTVKERDILLLLVEAMAEDVQHARDGKKEPSAVKQFDVGGLSIPLAIQCNYMQNDFIELYNQCDEQGNNVDRLEMVYDHFSELVRSVVNQAEIVPEVEGATVPTA